MLADSVRGQGGGWSASTRAGRRDQDNTRKSHHPVPNTGRHTHTHIVLRYISPNILVWSG